MKNRFPERLLRFRNLETSNIEDGTVNYPLRFKELFSYAADNLAQSIKQPLESIGVLFEGILETGTARKPARNIFSREPSAEQGDDNSESERHGQLLFVVRRLDRAVAARMQSKGYRFASFPHILNSLACSLKITTRELSECLDKLWQYSERDALLDQGVYLTSFILRPILNRQFDVLVRRDARNLLPTTQLPMLKLEEWQLDFLTRFNNCTVATVCNRLESESSDFNEGERDFASQLLEAIKELAEKVGDTYFQEARLNARPMQGPCIMPDKSLNLQSGIMIVFTIITDIHEASNPNEHYEFEPLSFFSCQQHAYQGSPDCDAFRHVVDRDFSMLGQHHGPDNGAIEMQQVRVGGETSTASADSVTFVDQLIGLINEERALRRRTEESMQAI